LRGIFFAITLRPAYLGPILTTERDISTATENLRSAQTFHLTVVVAVQLGLALSGRCPPLAAQTKPDADYGPARRWSASTLANIVVSDQPTLADTVLVCPDAWMKTLQPWLRLRHAQGHKLIQIPNVSSAHALRRQIVQLSKKRPLRFVVLVGDTASPGTVPDENAEPTIPTFYAPAKVNVKYGSEPTIPTDHPYGDLDADGQPELAVGRLAVSSVDELAVLVEKILAFEQSQRRGLWQRRVHFVAGMGGFGRVRDAVIETAAKKFLTDGVPPSHRATMTYASLTSPYCPNPDSLRKIILGSLNQGSLFWIYMGHGHPYRLDRFKIGEEGYVPLLEASDVDQLHCGQGHPIAVVMACYTGAFDQSICLAESMLRQEGGPVAVLAGSRVTMPYGMATLGSGLLRSYFNDHPETLGEVILRAKQDMFREGSDVGKDRQFVDGMAKFFQQRTHDLADERREHVLLFNLLGDPLLRPIYPREIDVDVPSRIRAGESLTVRFESPVTGWAAVELVCRRDRLTFTPERRSLKDMSQDDWSAMTEVHRRANDKRWAARQFRSANHTATISLTVPEIAKGPAYVRVFVQGPDNFAVGAGKTFIRRAGVDDEGPMPPTATNVRP